MTDHLRIEGCLVGRAELSPPYGSLDPPDHVYLFHTPSGGAWTLLVMSRAERYNDDGQFTSCSALVALSHYGSVAELADTICDRYLVTGWRALLQASDISMDPDLAREWATERIEQDFDQASIYNKDLAISSGLLDPAPVPAVGRQLEDWRRNALRSMAAHLSETGFEVLDTTLTAPAANESPDPLVGNPVVGELRVRRYGFETDGVVRVDNVGEIFVRLRHPDDADGTRLVPASDIEDGQ